MLSQKWLGVMVLVTVKSHISHVRPTVSVRTVCMWLGLLTEVSQLFCLFVYLQLGHFDSDNTSVWKQLCSSTSLSVQTGGQTQSQEVLKFVPQITSCQVIFAAQTLFLCTSRNNRAVRSRKCAVKTSVRNRFDLDVSPLQLPD